jgi:serine/threonine-protein kinase
VRGRLALEDVVEYVLQTLEALAEAHRHRIIHRDLKPANLFLTTREDDSGFIKVLDFGVSKLVDWETTSDGTVTRQGAMLGSPIYMSPEQIQDASTVDERSDIWSLGAVMHELLVGTPPFDVGPIASVIRAICTQPYRPPEGTDLPPECIKILVRCLRKQREERFQSAEELALAFRPLARTSAAHVSINRILRIRGSAPPPRLEAAAPRPEAFDSAANSRLDAPLPSVTPVESDTVRSLPPANLLRHFTLAFVAAGAVLATLWLAPGVRDASRPAVTVTAQPAPAALPPTRPTLPTVEPEPVQPKHGDARKAPVATGAPPVADKAKVRKTVRASPVSETHPAVATSDPGAASTAAFPSTPTGQSTPALPLRGRLRPLDTENPFRK